jgi:adenylate cyclase
MTFRIGINLGDVIEEEGRIYGDGVNVAARLESLAEAGGICISGAVYNHVKNKLQFRYEDQGEQSVKNIEEPVRVYRVLMDSESAGKEPVKPKTVSKWQRNVTVALVVSFLILASIATIVWNTRFRIPDVESLTGAKDEFKLPDKPSIAVLPFVNMSGDPEQEYFSDGLTEDLITDLSKFKNMFVISRNSVFLYKGKAVNPKQVSEELGVRYVLDGSVRKSDNRVRITVQLIDATTGGHLWAERYDQDLKDIFTLQDDITQQILSALDVKFQKIEQERALRKDTANLNAFDYNLLGWWYFQHFTREDNNQARMLFEKAIKLEPKFAGAYAGLGFTYYEQWARLWSQEPQTLERAFELAKRAISLNDSLSTAYSLLGHVYLWRKQHTQAIAELERAVALEPNKADFHADLADILVWTGRPQEALGLIEKAMRLNPHYPARYSTTLGLAYLLMEQYEEALTGLKRALTLSPDDFGIHLMLAFIYSKEGREEEARAHVTQALRLNPQLSIKDLKQRLPNTIEGMFDALRKAGLK